MNNLENKEILSAELIKVIDLIIEKCPDAVYGGSIALNAVGLLNRKISDIDLFINKNTSLNRNGFLSISFDDKINSETATDTNGELIQRTGTKINGIKVCVFKVNEPELQHSIFEFNGRKIKIQNVNHAIRAKLAYSKKNEKHIIDLAEIAKKLEEIF